MRCISPQTMVREIMSLNVLFVGPDQISDQCMALMTNSRLRHLPVMEYAPVTFGNEMTQHGRKRTYPRKPLFYCWLWPA